MKKLENWVLLNAFLWFLVLSVRGHAAETTPAFEAQMATLEVAYQATALADELQTLSALRHGYTETNPFLGTRPTQGAVISYFVLYDLSHAIIARELVQTGHDKAAKIFEYLTIGYEAGTVVRNARVEGTWRF